MHMYILMHAYPNGGRARIPAHHFTTAGLAYQNIIFQQQGQHINTSLYDSKASISTPHFTRAGLAHQHLTLQKLDQHINTSLYKSRASISTPHFTRAGLVYQHITLQEQGQQSSFLKSRASKPAHYLDRGEKKTHLFLASLMGIEPSTLGSLVWSQRVKPITPSYRQSGIHGSKAKPKGLVTQSSLRSIGSLITRRFNHCPSKTVVTGWTDIANDAISWVRNVGSRQTDVASITGEGCT